MLILFLLCPSHLTQHLTQSLGFVPSSSCATLGAFYPPPQILFSFASTAFICFRPLNPRRYTLLRRPLWALKPLAALPSCPCAIWSVYIVLSPANSESRLPFPPSVRPRRKRNAYSPVTTRT